MMKKHPSPSFWTASDIIRLRGKEEMCCCEQLQYAATGQQCTFNYSKGVAMSALY